MAGADTVSQPWKKWYSTIDQQKPKIKQGTTVFDGGSGNGRLCEFHYDGSSKNVVVRGMDK